MRQEGCGGMGRVKYLGPDKNVDGDPGLSMRQPHNQGLTCSKLSKPLPFPPWKHSPLGAGTLHFYLSLPTHLVSGVPFPSLSPTLSPSLPSWAGPWIPHRFSPLSGTKAEEFI